MTSESVLAFQQWLERPEIRMRGVKGPKSPDHHFIPRSSLDDYLTEARISELLDDVLDSDRSGVNARVVKKNYLRTFAILICTGFSRLIVHVSKHRNLRDDQLPFCSMPEGFPKPKDGYFEDFQDCQWQFCATELHLDTEISLGDEDILPFITKKRIGQGGSATIYKIVIESSYNELVRPSRESIETSQFPDTFVLKAFTGPEARTDYKTELDAYRKLAFGGRSAKYILSCYASFYREQSGEYYIILEYADMGNLEEYMRSTTSPRIIEEAVLFWDRFSDIMCGVAAIHNATNQDQPARQSLIGWHQDLKPANILVFSASDGESPYNCHFKIADLGLLHFKHEPNPTPDSADYDSFGTRTYGAPETYRHDNFEELKLLVKQEVDIWSCGCIFSEVAVWTANGHDAVKEYRRQRGQAVEELGGTEGDNYFHHDGEVLAVVEEVHATLKRNVSSTTQMTVRLLETIAMMLQETNSRPNARTVHTSCKRVVDETEKVHNLAVTDRAKRLRKANMPPGQANERPKTPGQLPPGYAKIGPGSGWDSSYTYHNSPIRDCDSATDFLSDNDSMPSPSSPPESMRRRQRNQSKMNGENVANHEQKDRLDFPVAGEPSQVVLNLEQALEWKVRKKKVARYGRPLFGQEGPALPGHEHLPSVDNRNHIFIVDNSESMKTQKTYVKQVVEILAYILKDRDKTGLDLHFTQSLSTINASDATAIVKAVDKENFRGLTDMKGRLTSILKPHKAKFGQSLVRERSRFGFRSQPKLQSALSIYILTDGKWMPRNDVATLILNVVKHLESSGLEKEHVAIQFIRFGNDANGTARMNHLDSGLGLKARKMDIVDTTVWNGNVWKHLLGALNEWYDDE